MVFWRGLRDIEYVRLPHDDAEPEVLKAVARQRLAAAGHTQPLPGRREIIKGRRERAPAGHAAACI